MNHTSWLLLLPPLLLARGYGCGLDEPIMLSHPATGGSAPAAGSAGVQIAGAAGAAAQSGAAGHGGADAGPPVPGGVWTGEGRAVYVEAECAHGPEAGSCQGRFAGSQEGTELGENGSTVGWFGSDDYLMYPGIDFTGLNTLYVTHATRSSGNVEVRIDGVDGELLAEFHVATTGGWTAWRGMLVPLAEASGVHDLYLVGGGTDARWICNLDWMVLGVCSPDCGGKDCGPDSCGGVCGSCPENHECSREQQCELCVPLCDGKECGDDTCGGWCGSCSEGEVCNAARQCVAYADMADLPRLHVEGNALVDPAGSTVVLRGVSLMDLGVQELTRSGGVTAVIDQLTFPGWETKVVRFPVNDEGDSPWQMSLDYRLEREQYLEELLRPAVDYATERGLYVIIDLHFIADVTEDNDQQALAFWRTMAPQFADYPNVIYELYNEPIDFDPDCLAGLIDTCWAPFREKAEGWVEVVREAAPDTLLLVGGPAWSQVIGPAADDPVADDNVAYVAHFYPWTTGGATEAQIARCAAVHPVVLTEWGYETEDEQPYLDIVTGLIEDHELGWTAWVADHDWTPNMYSNPEGELTPFGQVVQQMLAEAVE